VPGSFVQAVKASFAESVGDIVFGMEDGTVSIFGLVFGIAASVSNSQPVLLAGRRHRRRRGSGLDDSRHLPECRNGAGTIPGADRPDRRHPARGYESWSHDAKVREPRAGPHPRTVRLSAGPDYDPLRRLRRRSSQRGAERPHPLDDPLSICPPSEPRLKRADHSRDQ
jgi:hypothetical protein